MSRQEPEPRGGSLDISFEAFEITVGSVRLAFDAVGPIRVRRGSIHSRVVDEFEVPYVVRASVS